jgi:site-specific DNA recombinase
LESQKNEMLALAEKHGLQIVSILEESRSAKAEGRPVFQEMLSQLHSGKIDGILCWKLDRLARNMADGGRIMDMLQRGVIKEIRTHEAIHLPTDNVLLLAVSLGMANQYIRDLSENVKRGNRAKLDRGEWPYRPPVGYKNNVVNKTIAVDQKHVKTVQRIYEVYNTGLYSFGEVTDILHREGFRGQKGGKIYLSRVARILENPFYCGMMLRQGVLYSGKHKPLISKAIWDKAQEVSNKKLHPRAQTLFFPLRGFLNCTCGCMYTASLKKGHQYYYCTNGKGVCNEHKVYLNSKKADSLILEALEKIHIDEELIEIAYLAACEKIQATDTHNDEAQTRLEARLEALDAKESSAFDSFSSGVLSKSIYESKVQEIKNERLAVKKDLEGTKYQDPKVTLERTKDLFLQASKAKNEYLIVGDEQKQKLVSSVLWNLTLQGQNIVQTKYKPVFELLANTPQKSDFASVRAHEESNLDHRIWRPMFYH